MTFLGSNYDFFGVNYDFFKNISFFMSIEKQVIFC